jgi:serine/threonine protein kinase
MGVLLYELLTGINPQRAQSPGEVLRNIGDRDPAPPSSQNPGIPRDLDAIVLKSTAKDPQLRYSSAAELSSEIQRFLHGRPVQARTPSVVYRTGKFVRRNRLLTAAMLSVIVTLLGGLVASTWQARIAERERQGALRALALAEDRQKGSGSSAQRSECTTAGSRAEPLSRRTAERNGPAAERDR